jgi:hypothetical protein
MWLHAINCKASPIHIHNMYILCCLQELQGTVQKTLQLLADPTAGVLGPGAATWPLPQPPASQERAQAERWVHVAWSVVWAVRRMPHALSIPHTYHIHTTYIPHTYHIHTTYIHTHEPLETVDIPGIHARMPLRMSTASGTISVLIYVVLSPVYDACYDPASFCNAQVHVFPSYILMWCDA